MKPVQKMALGVVFMFFLLFLLYPSDPQAQDDNLGRASDTSRTSGKTDSTHHAKDDSDPHNNGHDDHQSDDDDDDDHQGPGDADDDDNDDDDDSSIPSSMDACLAKWGAQHEDSADAMNDEAGTCPRMPTVRELSEFTMNGRIGVEDWYQCQTGSTYEQRHHYTQAQVDEAIGLVQEKHKLYYGRTDLFLYNAFADYPLEDLEVAVMGSQRPIYESFCLAYHAKKCTTIDFQRITSDDPRLHFMTIAQYSEDPVAFDAAISISSFEHDGLGRYGDPLRPNGDLEMMKKMKCVLREGGLLFLSVPIARDKIVWNMHRVYGRVRLPELIKHWTLKAVYGDEYYYDRWTGCDARGEGDYQPIYVLENSIPPEGHNQKMLDSFLLDGVPAHHATGKKFSCFETPHDRNPKLRPSQEALDKALDLWGAVSGDVDSGREDDYY